MHQTCTRTLFTLQELTIVNNTYKMDWNQTNTLHFISLIKDRPAIWNTSCPDNINKDMREAAMNEVSSLMGGFTMKEGFMKWGNLKSQYRREKRRIRDFRPSQWFAYLVMKELVDCNESMNASFNGEYKEEQMSYPVSPSSVMAGESSPQPEATPDRAESKQRVRATMSVGAPRRTFTTALYSEAIQTLRTIKENRRKASDLDDDITTFRKYVDAQFRKFKPLMQSKAKFEITSLLHKYEMENLKVMESSSRARESGSVSNNYDYEYGDDIANDSKMTLLKEI